MCLLPLEGVASRLSCVNTGRQQAVSAARLPARLPSCSTSCPVQAAAACERHPLLASVVQRYGHMYYHFVMETLPRSGLQGGAWLRWRGSAGGPEV